MLIFLKALAEIQTNLKKWKISGFAVTWLVFASLCVSQEREIVEVLIIGDNADLMNLAGSGAQVTPEKVQFHKYSDLNQLVSLVPGVYVREEDGFGLRPNIGIRGATSDRSQKVTILEDGVLIGPAPYSAPAAYYITNAARLESLEVLKGPSAIISGPHTVGGTINLLTRPVPKDNQHSISAEFGSDGYRKIRAESALVNSYSGVLIDALRYESDGFKYQDNGEDTGFVRNDINIKLQHKFDTSNDQIINIKLGYADEDANETYLGLTDSDFEQSPNRRYAASQLDNFVSDHSQIHVSYDLLFQDKLNVNSKVYWNKFNRSWNKFDGFIDGPRPQDVLSSPESYRSAYETLLGVRDSVVGDFTDLTIDVTDNYREFSSKGFQVDLQTELAFLDMDHSFRFGFRYHIDDVRRQHQQRSYLMRSGILVDDAQLRPLKSDNYAESKAMALFVSDEINFNSLKVTVGLRHEEISGEFDNKLSGVITSNKQSITAPGLGFYYEITQNLGVLAGIYRGFSPAGPGKEGTKAEESTNIEYGFRYHTDYMNVELIAFESDYANLLGRCRASDSDCEIGQEFTGGEASVKGAEFMVGQIWKFSDAISLSADFVYTYSTSKFQSSFFSNFSQWGLVSEGDSLPYIPDHVGRLDLKMDINDVWDVVVSSKYQHGMREVPGSASIQDDLHTDNLKTVDLSFSRSIINDLQFKVSVRNALNDRYIVSHRPFGARPNLPRMVMLEMRYDI